MQLIQIDYTTKTANLDFVKSLKKTGFAVIKNHPIDQQLIADVFKEWEGFYSSDYKNNYLFNKDTQDGLFPITVSETAVGYNVRDIKEFFHFYEWGQYPRELSDKTKELLRQLCQVAKQLLTWVEDSLPIELKSTLSEPLTQMIENSNQTLLRILHYPPLTGNEEEGAVRASAHADINLLTVLVAASQSGLQLQNANGDWVDVPVDPGMLAINIGDGLQEATQGFYKSTIHRVVNPTGDLKYKSRYSIPLFLHARPDVVLSQRYTAHEFLTQRLIEIGLK
jgi:isopenicillin N synthase-like dioxygenase